MHVSAFRRIAKYFAGTSTYMYLLDVNWRLTTHGVVYRPDIEKFIECYVYAKFSCGWAQGDADNAKKSMLLAGYVITYVGCPVLFCSKLQT